MHCPPCTFLITVILPGTDSLQTVSRAPTTPAGESFWKTPLDGQETLGQCFGWLCAGKSYREKGMRTSRSHHVSSSAAFLSHNAPRGGGRGIKTSPALCRGTLCILPAGAEAFRARASIPVPQRPGPGPLLPTSSPLPPSTARSPAPASDWRAARRPRSPLAVPAATRGGGGRGRR